MSRDFLETATEFPLHRQGIVLYCQAVWETVSGRTSHAENQEPGKE